MEAVQRFINQVIMSYKSMYAIMDLKVILITKVLSPLSSMLFFCYVALNAYGSEDMLRWIIGNVFITSVFPVFLGAGLAMGRERDNGTLQIILATPTNRFFMFISRSVMHIVDAVFISLIGFFIAVPIFHVSIANFPIQAFVLTVIVSMFAAIAFGMAFGSLAMVIRDVSLFMNVGILGMTFVTGANVALSNLPGFIRVISMIIPVTRGIEASRYLIDHPIDSVFWGLIGQEFLIGCCYLLIGYYMFIAIERKAREASTLDVY